MSPGDIFLIGNAHDKDATVDLTAMYVYLCDHPWNQIEPKFNVIVCSRIYSTDDTNIKIKFLKNNGNFTVVAKHEDEKWVRSAAEVVRATYENQNLIDFMEQVRNSDPETRNKILGDLNPDNIRKRVQQKKLLDKFNMVEEVEKMKKEGK